MTLHLRKPIPPITPATAGWEFLSFRWGPIAAPVSDDTGDRELALVVIAGRVAVDAGSTHIEAGTGPHVAVRRHARGRVPAAGNRVLGRAARRRRRGRVLRGGRGPGEGRPDRARAADDVRDRDPRGGQRDASDQRDPGARVRRRTACWSSRCSRRAGSWSSFPPHKHDVLRAARRGGARGGLRLPHRSTRGLRDAARVHPRRRARRGVRGARRRRGARAAGLPPVRRRARLRLLLPERARGRRPLDGGLRRSRPRLGPGRRGSRSARTRACPSSGARGDSPHRKRARQLRRLRADRRPRRPAGGLRARRDDGRRSATRAASSGRRGYFGDGASVADTLGSRGLALVGSFLSLRLSRREQHRGGPAEPRRHARAARRGARQRPEARDPDLGRVLRARAPRLRRAHRGAPRDVARRRAVRAAARERAPRGRALPRRAASRPRSTTTPAPTSRRRARSSASSTDSTRRCSASASTPATRRSAAGTRSSCCAPRRPGEPRAPQGRRHAPCSGASTPRAPGSRAPGRRARSASSDGAAPTCDACIAELLRRGYDGWIVVEQDQVLRPGRTFADAVDSARKNRAWLRGARSVSPLDLRADSLTQLHHQPRRRQARLCCVDASRQRDRCGATHRYYDSG